jgi:NAD+-dependent secondary alcohol dehydrogenase Adh1
MRAQVLYEYDSQMKNDVWVKAAEWTDPKIEKSSDVIVKIGAAGVCRTDLHIIEGVWRHIQDPDNKLLPCIMGHENAGWVEHDMHAENGAFPGLNIKEGGYAEYLKTSVRNLIKLPQGLTPKDVAPFSDAGLTAYRVVKKATRHLLPGEACVIIGAGGLGHIAIQCLKAMCAADIIVVEKSQNALNHALELGADKGVLIDGNEVNSILELTNGKGAEAVIDFVGEHGSTSMGLNMTANAGYYYIVGYGEEIKVLAVDMIISEKNIIGNLVGTWAELYELMELANKGLVKLSMQEYSLDDANKALHDLNEGNVKGRAVLVP